MKTGKFSLSCRKYMKSCLAELGVELIKFIDAAGRVYHLRRSQSGQAVQMTWWTCGEFFYSLCGVKDLNVSFAPTRGFPPEFWISLSVPMNRLRSGSIQRLQTGIVPTHAAFCHVQFAFVPNGRMASLTNRCLHPIFFLDSDKLLHIEKLSLAVFHLQSNFVKTDFWMEPVMVRITFLSVKVRKEVGGPETQKRWECCLWKNWPH